MALSARELLLIIRAQNQASGALRRVAGDMKGLGRIQDLNLRRNQLAIAQSQLIRQRMSAEARLADVTTGRRRILAEQEAMRLMHERSRLEDNIKTAAQRREIVERQIARARKRGLKMDTDRMKRLIVQADSYARAIRNYENALNRIPRAMQAQAGRMRNLDTEAKKLGNELRTIDQRMNQVRGRMSALDREIRHARWDRLTTGFRALSHVGRVVQLAGLGAGAALGYLANQAAEFSERATLVATQTGRIGSGMQTIVKNAEYLSKRILETMGQSTSSMEEVEAAAYDIFSSLTLPDGGKGLKIGTDMLEQMSDAAIAGMTDIETVTEGVVATLGAFEEFPRTTGGVNRILNRMFAAVRFGRMTFAEFAQTLGTTAPAARAAGQSLDTMAGTIAFLSRPLGVNKAAVGFARLTEIIGRKTFVQGLRKVGVEIVDAGGKMLQLPEIISKITKRFPDLTRGGVKLVQFFKKMSGTEGTIQARRAFVFLAQQMDQYRHVLGQTTNDNNEFDRSLRAMSQTAGVKWKKAMNTLRTLGIEIGTAVIPVLVEMLEPVQDLLKWFQQLDPEVKEQIGRWLAWGAALLLVGGTLAVIIGTIGSIVSTLASLGVLFSSITVTVGLVAAAIVLLTGDFEALGDIASRVMDFFSGSWQGFLAGAALAAVAAVRLTNAIKNMGVTFAAVRVAMIGGLATLAASIPAAAAGVGIFAAVMYRWRQRAEEARQAAAALAAELQNVANNIEVATFSAERFANITTFMKGFERATLQAEDITARIKDLRKELKEADKGERPGIRRQIQMSILDRADAYAEMRKQAGLAGASIQRFNEFLQAQGTIQASIAQKERQIAELRQFIAGIRERTGDAEIIPPHLAVSIENAQTRIRQLQDQIYDLGRGSQEASQVLGQSFATIVRDLQDMGRLPKGITGGMIQDVLALQTKLGRVLSAKEMKLVFKALVDPKSMADIPKKIARFLRSQRKERVEVEADIKLARHKLGIKEVQEQARRGVTFEADADTGKATTAIDNFLKFYKGVRDLPPFIPHADADAAVSLGVQLAQGVQAGFNSVNLSKTIVVNVQTVRTDVARSEGVQSPAKKWMTDIGIPMAQGIVFGFIRELAGGGEMIREIQRLRKKLRKDLSKDERKETLKELREAKKEYKKAMREAWEEILDTASQTLLDKFNEFRDTLEDTIFDPITELNELRLEWGLPLDVKQLTADLKSQTSELRTYQKNWAGLVKRGVPLQLLLQLAEMGEEGQAIIGALAGSSKKDLNDYIKAWKDAQKQLDKAARQQLRTQVKRWRQMGRAMAFGIIAGLRDEQQRLKNFFEKMFKDLFRQGQRTNRSRSPSKLWAEEGKNIVDGLVMGMASRDLAVPQPAIGGGLRRGRAVRTTTSTPMNITVNANRDESLMTTLERMRFRMKHRT